LTQIKTNGNPTYAQGADRARAQRRNNPPELVSGQISASSKTSLKSV
jgi:hypothetical protein